MDKINFDKIYSETARQLIEDWNEKDGATIDGVGYLPPYNHLDYLITRALDEQRRAALEEACKAVCRRCRLLEDKPEFVGGTYKHWVSDGLQPRGESGRWAGCAAAAIRALMGEAVTHG